MVKFMSLSDLNISDKILRCHYPENRKKEAILMSAAIGTWPLGSALGLASFGMYYIEPYVRDLSKKNLYMLIPSIACSTSAAFLAVSAIMMPLTSGIIICHIHELRQEDNQLYISNVGDAAARA